MNKNPVASNFPLKMRMLIKRAIIFPKKTKIKREEEEDFLSPQPTVVDEVPLLWGKKEVKIGDLVVKQQKEETEFLISNSFCLVLRPFESRKK